jgi:hypothetical protein
MPSQRCCVERETKGRVTLGETKEGVVEAIGIQDGGIVLDHVGHIHEDLITFQTHSSRWLYLEELGWKQMTHDDRFEPGVLLRRRRDQAGND